MNDDDGYHGVLLPKPYQLTKGTLTDDEGDAYRLPQDIDKPLTLVFFGYTKCPDICQVVMNDLTAAVARLDDEHRAQVGMLLITSDPARDDPATLKTYLSRFNPDFVGLTGPLAEITRIGGSVGIAIEKGDKLPSGGYAVAHGTYVLGVRPGGSAALVWNDDTSSQDMADDITQALDSGFAKVGSDS